MDTKAFWNRVKKLLKEKNITQIEAAKACDFSVYTFRGRMAKEINPPICDALKIARLLGVSLDYLVSGPSAEKNAKVNREVVFLLKKASEKLTRTVC